MDNIKNFNELPLTLSASDISQVLGISKVSAYSMFKRNDFPTIKIGKRCIVSLDKFIDWLEEHTRGYES